MLLVANRSGLTPPAAVPAPVESTAAMEVTTAVKATTSMETAVEFAPTEATALESTSEPAIKPAPVVASPIVTVTVVAPAITVPSRSVKSVEPRPSADERAIHEPIRTVVPVWRAGVGIITIVAIRADRRRTDIAIGRSDSYTDHHALRMRVGRAKQANSQQANES
jgi:hypothetical protein